MVVELLAANAVAMVAPYLVELSKGAAESVGGEAAKSVLNWMRAKLGGSAKEALNDLEQNPQAEDYRTVLRVGLTKALADPALAEELRKLMPPTAGLQIGSMEQTVSGAGAAGGQVVGSGNQTSVSGNGN